MAGLTRQVNHPLAKANTIKKPSPLASQYSTYDAAVNQNAEDYDRIMGNYKNLFEQGRTAGNDTVTPTLHNYAPTKDYTDSVSRLKDLADTGGYSDQDRNDLRERGISPIRSVYANANREINRSRSLSQGGTGAMYAALKSKMAREVSEKVANQVTNVNAGIAERVAQNKIGTASTLAGTTAAEQAERNKHGAMNANTQTETDMFNKRRKDTSQDRQMQATEGMRGLYGTTPALSATFGNQAMSAASLQNNIFQQNRGNVIQAGNMFRRRG